MSDRRCEMSEEGCLVFKLVLNFKFNGINMKTIMKTLVSGGLVMLLTMTLIASCENGINENNESATAALLDVSADGTSVLLLANLAPVMVAGENLTSDELSLLLKMKDEEKLAKDVYAVLYPKWQSPVFSRIGDAESNHLDAVIRLLTFYSKDASVGQPGEFASTEYKNLYDKLIARGSVNLTEAFKVGALIEEMDIKDLEDALQIVTNANVKIVFENLQKGSRNHLRAFNRQLSAIGESYTPIYLSSSEYNTIVSSPNERGGQYNMGGNQQHRKGKGGRMQGGRW